MTKTPGTALQNKVEKLLEIVTDTEKTELTVLNNAVVKNIRAYRADPSVANKKNWDAAQEGFDNRVRQLWEKYFEDEEAEEASKLKNIPAVVDYLDGQGWKISKSAAYKHKKEGKLRPGSDGRFSFRAVDKYARQWLEKKDGSESESAEDLQAQKAQAELEKIKAQARHWDTKTKIELGQYVPREDWDRELAARARVFKSDIENFIRTEATEVIRIANGDPDKAPDLIEYYLRQAETWMNRYTQEKTWKVTGAGNEHS
jgi:hypothetical protein